LLEHCDKASGEGVSTLGRGGRKYSRKRECGWGGKKKERRGQTPKLQAVTYSHGGERGGYVGRQGKGGVQSSGNADSKNLTLIWERKITKRAVHPSWSTVSRGEENHLRER